MDCEREGQSLGNQFYAALATTLSTDLSTNVEISQGPTSFVGPQFSAKTPVLLVLWLFTAVVPGNTGAPIPTNLMGSNSYFFFL